MKRIVNTLLLAAAAAGLAACASGRPEFTPIEHTLNQATKKPIVPTTVMLPPPVERAPGSLWRQGSKQFFKDSRATNVGDIITIVVTERAKAETEANTKTNAEHTGTGGISNLLNVEGLLTNRGIPPGVASLFDVAGNRDFKGEGKTDRTDTLEARIAAVVTQVLPNGYMVVQGKREVIVNYEMQELSIQGIVRPEDVSADNTISSEKIAEARISYAGRGIVDESQEPAPGVRFLNKWMPF